MQEVAETFELSISTIQGYFKELELKGAITKETNKTRAVTITDLDSQKTKTVSISGTISAGSGISIFETFDEFINVPENWVQSSTHQYYALKVSGFSMYQDGILDGDIVVIRKQNFAENGDTIVAIIHSDADEKATLKKFKDLNKETIELIPSNDQLDPIKVKRENLEIRGLFVGLIRR
jgi:repressor LexA